MKRLLKQAEQGISFIEILLDETICDGELYVDKELVRRVGGINAKLENKQKYECVLRIAQNTPVEFVDEFEESDKLLCLLDSENMSESTWKTDAYVIGKYSEELKANGVFEAAINAVIEDACQVAALEDAIPYLEKMIGRSEEFHAIDRCTQPILVYKGDDICHNVLNIFAEQFGKALEECGCNVMYFDVSQRPIEDLLLFRNKQFKAIIGVQSYLFSVKMKDEIHYLHEYIYGPKFNFIFDHPIWLKKHLEHRYSDFYVLTHDIDYVSFVEKYFSRKAILFPPAGMAAEDIKEEERKYDLTFVGTYGDYWQEVLLIHKMERKIRFIANHFLLVMRKNVDMSAEEALQKVLKIRNLQMNQDEFMELLYELRRVIYCVMHYYRHNVLVAILESGIQLDVFGDSWYNCPLKQYSNLICHPNVTVEESLKIWKQSKLSLNIMSWHKAGFTERMANIMLAGAVLVTDETRYLQKDYCEEDMLVFGLNEKESLADRIRFLLENESIRCKMAEAGRQKTLEQHMWKNRAEEFLKLL